MKERSTNSGQVDCPRVRSEDYILFPPLPPDLLYEMEAAFLRDDLFPFGGHEGDGERRQCLFFVRDNLTGKGYVDIYLLDPPVFGDHLQRFVICDGYALVDSEEELLLTYIKGTKMMPDEDAMDRLYWQVTDRLPHWHYHPYPRNEFGQALKHLYFSSHRSGCREILYKANLNNIASVIESIPFHDPLGSTPEKIIGQDIPLRLLRILNEYEDLEVLQDKEKLRAALCAYRKYSGFTEGRQPSKGQWDYLKALSDRRGGRITEQMNNRLFNGGFSRALYRKLENDDSGSRYRRYVEYLRLRDEISLRGDWKLPMPEDLDKNIEKLRAIKRYRDEGGFKDQKIAARKENENLEYEGGEYCLLMPSSCLEICLEGLYQKNCVASYILSHTAAATTILFLRRKSAPDRSFVTVEVRNSMIIQVYAKMNTLPDASVFRFLEDYCREKAIVLNPYLLAAKEIVGPEKLEELEDEGVENRDHLRKLTEEGWSLLGTGLKEYILGYRERYEWKPFPCWDPLFSNKVIRVQVTLEDLFPEAFRQVNR